MKNSLLVLFVVIMFSSCTTEEIKLQKIDIENTVNTQKTGTPTIWYESIIDIYYDRSLDHEEIDHTRDYYFNKFNSSHARVRLSMSDGFPLESHHEQWLELKFHFQGHPEEDEPDDEVGHDPRLDMSRP